MNTFSIIPMLASADAAAASEAASRSGDLKWQIAAIAAIMLINAFFVIAEFAMVKVRSSQLQGKAGEGDLGAKLALEISGNAERYLSATQLGITFMSIAIGSVGEPAIASLIRPLLERSGMGSPAIVHTVATVLAFIAITFMQVVLAEQTPKRLAIRYPLASILWVAKPLHFIYLALKPFTVLLNAATNLVMRWVFRMGARDEGSAAHSEEELRHIVAESERSKEVTETEKDILLNALALNDLCARDIMTPRNQVISLDVEDGFEANLKVAISSQHTRFPLVEGHLDQTIGLIHIKDMLRIMKEPAPDLRKIKREIVPVPEMMPIDKLLRVFLDKHAHIALVVDEFGGAVGIVTLDNVVEEIVGDIQDEFDAEKSEFTRINDREFTVEGTLNLYELKDLAGIEIESEEVTTIGGYVTHLIGHLPKAGEKTVIEDYEVTASKVDQRRVLQLHFRRTARSESDEEAMED